MRRAGGQGRAGQGRAGEGKTGQGRAGEGKTGQGRVRSQGGAHAMVRDEGISRFRAHNAHAFAGTKGLESHGMAPVLRCTAIAGMASAGVAP